MRYFRGVLIKDATKICMLTRTREMWMAFEQEKTKRAFSNALYLCKLLYEYSFTQGMDMEKYFDKTEAMRHQLRNKNDEVSDNDIVKLILQGVAFEYREGVRMFDQDVCDGSMSMLSEVLSTLRTEADVDKQRGGMTNKTAKLSDGAKISQVNEQQQLLSDKGKRR
ncbi:gag-polypeptide of LTR copia-type [Phytophthora infestans]|uniref:Gag-polypeptide of LTR copia-type n=1 Tax=Phytophthora infestans TaxID=4787 RepID=A0A8S9TS62_PHYIN|nr:gag-polypeptide of LTR copia-type [Phytophthora infestans]